MTDGSGNLSWVTPVSNGTFSAQPQWSGVPSGTNDLTNKAYVDAQVVAGLPNVGTPGTYSKVTTDTKGRVTAGTSLAEADIPNLVSAGKVSGAAINAGTLGGSAAINTTGNLVTTGTVSAQTLSATHLRFYNSSNYLEFTAPTLSGNTSFILPSGDSTGTQYLRSDGAGNLSWGTPGGAGTVNTGAVDQLAFYAAAGNTVSGLSTSPNGVLVTNGSSTPSISSTLPSAVQNNISGVGTITTGTWNGGLISAYYGGTGINSGAAANGTLLIGNGAGFNLTNLNQSGNQGVTIANGSGSISLGTVQDIRTTAAPSFSGVVLNNAGTNLSQSVSVGTSYGITWPGTAASTAGSVLTSTTGGSLSWTPAVPAVNGGTGQTSYATGDLLYASSPSTLAKLSPGTSGFVLTSNGGGTAPSWQGLPAASLSSLTPAVSSNTMDNLNYAQNWNWSTVSTQTPLSLTANSLTTGTALNISTSSNTLNSSNGLLSVVNSGTSTAGVFAKLQANSAPGSGMTLLTNGYVGIGIATPPEPVTLYSNSSTGPALTLANSANNGTLQQTVINLETLNNGTGSLPFGVAGTKGWQFYANSNNYGGGPNLMGLTFYDGTSWHNAVEFSPGSANESNTQFFGQIVGSVNSGAGTTIDFNTGNTQTTSSSCTTMTLNNLLPGGTYHLIVTGGGSTMCILTGSGMTFKYRPTNAAVVGGYHAVYHIFVANGSTAYVDWNSGY